MKRVDLLLLALLGIAGGTVAYASETITYRYDARGRLIRVERSGTVNNKVSANYLYDKADNRTNVNVRFAQSGALRAFRHTSMAT